MLRRWRVRRELLVRRPVPRRGTQRKREATRFRRTSRGIEQADGPSRRLCNYMYCQAAWPLVNVVEWDQSSTPKPRGGSGLTKIQGIMNRTGFSTKIGAMAAVFIAIGAYAGWAMWPRPIERPDYSPHSPILRSEDMYVYPPRSAL